MAGGAENRLDRVAVEATGLDVGAELGSGLVGRALRAVITYDNRMTDAAAVLGLPTVGPA